MRTKTFLSLLVTVAVLTLSGCGGSDDGNNNNNNNNSNSNNSSTDANNSYSKKFKSQNISAQVEELFGGIIGIADEVGNGKMGDPLGESLAKADVTKVESQFSWNSTMDFYNNIQSIKNVWNGGLKNIAQKADAGKAAAVTTQIEEALALMAQISDQDGDNILEASDLADGTKAFRNMISDAGGRARIEATIAKLAQLQTSLETLKPIVTDKVTDADKTDAANVVDNVIVKGYNDLTSESIKLVTALTTLKNAPTAANVTAARTQWRAARTPWEAGEGHIFGPVDTLGVDPKVDSWPVDKASLDGALGGWDASLSNIDGFPVTMKGFHAIEYLLFGDGTKLETAEEAAIRLQTAVGEDAPNEKIRLKYLEALGVSFSKDISSLSKAWTN